MIAKKLISEFLNKDMNIFGCKIAICRWFSSFNINSYTVNTLAFKHLKNSENGFSLDEQLITIVSNNHLTIGLTEYF